MSRYELDANPNGLKGKVVLVTGGASGIGEGIVKLACSVGAHVVFSDLNEKLGRSVAQDTGATFVVGDMSKYHDILALFKHTYEKYGSVDYAISNAALYGPHGFFDPELTFEDIEKESTTSIIDVNVRGAIMAARIASVYLRPHAGATDDKALVFISSAPGLLLPENTPLYNTSKSAILGLTRTLAQILPRHHKIRANGICPSMTRTPLAVANALPAWEAAGLPVNSAEDVARAVLQTCCNVADNRKILYVEDGRAWDVEKPLLDLTPQWIGDGPMETLKKLGRLENGKDVYGTTS